MENRNELNPYECELCSFHIDEEGVLHLRAKESVHTYEKQIAAFEMIRWLTDGIRVPLLLDLTDASLMMFDLDTREYIARELPVLFSAVGVVAVTTLQKVAPTIFLNTMGQPVPMRMFSSREEAVRWLRHHV